MTSITDPLVLDQIKGIRLDDSRKRGANGANSFAMIARKPEGEWKEE
jgi:hypothetical protein